MCFRSSLETLVVIISALHMAHGWLFQHIGDRSSSKVSQLKHDGIFRCRRTMNFPMDLLALTPTTNDTPNDRQETAVPFTHADIQWKIRLPPETPFPEQMKWSMQTKKVCFDANLKKEPAPRLWLPPDNKQIVIEAWHHDTQVARFGITTQPGPSAPDIIDTVQEIYGDQDDDNTNYGCAAIIFMFVEPDYRARNLGSLALEVISYIHASRGADYTVLVADDKKGGKLVEWYQRQGFFLAPKLQELFGSPNQVYGITMIGRTKHELSSDCTIEWWS